MNNQRQGGLSFVVRGIAAGVGLASESIHHHNQKKAAKAAETAQRQISGSQSPPTYEEHEYKGAEPAADDKKGAEQGERSLEEGDEEQWDLDDAQDEIISKTLDPKKRPFERDPKKITQHFIDDYPVPRGIQQGKLPLPVVLPQRRPRDRTRGFIRAYAPVLMNCGIDQAMFLDFLETFNVASQASPWLNAINLASFALMPLPTGISQAASISIMLAVNVAKKMQSRYRYNSFLDQINDGFYRPRGLYCMMLTWEPDSDAMEIGVNINDTIYSNITPPEGIAQKTKHSMRTSMGKTHGFRFTETAPLIFPALDSLAGNDSHEAKTQKEKLKLAVNFTSDYFDRRAQAKYRFRGGGVGGGLGGFGGRGRGIGGGFGGLRGMGGMGGNRMAMSYGDGYGGVASRQGIAIGMGGMDQQQQQHSPNQQYPNQQYPNEQYANQMGRYNQQYFNQMSGYGGGMTGPGMLQQGIKRILRHHVLYILIVNMPTDEEMAEATRMVEQAQQQAA